jgi:hypothetical protein
MSLNDKFDGYKRKKELLEELNVYKSIILKKLDIDDFKSALVKTGSALTLIKEHQNYFDIENELGEFNELEQQARVELDNRRKVYLRRYDNLLKENLTEFNLENFTKLLAMLKSEVDENLNRYNLQELRDNINLYFKFIKKLYTIISSYRILNYNDASEKILNFIKDLKKENYPNLKSLILNIYQTLLLIQFEQMAEKFEKLTISEISEKLSIVPERIEDIINFIKNQPTNPIKKYVWYNKEVFFKS